MHVGAATRSQDAALDLLSAMRRLIKRMHLVGGETASPYPGHSKTLGYRMYK